MEAQAAELRRAVASAQAVIDAELAEVLARREEAARGVPAALLGRYETLRGRLDGVGAARLVNGRCAGCHLALPATEVDRIRHLPPDAMARCDHCGAILVR
jgi:predicted  nucleic acid-binding Zn-ribbon protein